MFKVVENKNVFRCIQVLKTHLMDKYGLGAPVKQIYCTKQNDNEWKETEWMEFIFKQWFWPDTLRVT